MEKRIKRRVLLLVIALAFVLAIPAAASSETKNVGITYRAIKLVVDGKEITPADRAAAGALGLSVDWVEDTSTVVLNSGGQVKTGSGAPAATKADKSIRIIYRDIKITIDGKEITPADASGTPVEPFIYDGTTYLPVRAVASALGVQVDWDAETSTVYLGERPKATQWLLKTETDYYMDGSVYYVETYTYDRLGRLTAIDTHYPEYPYEDSKITRSYDAAGNMISENYGDSYSQFAYDGNGNMISDKYYYDDDQVEWRYTYDAAGRHIMTTTLYGGETVGKTTHTYDARGDKIKTVDIKYGETVETRYTYTYNESGRLENAGYTDSSSGYEYGMYFVYTYDGSERLTVTHEYWVEDNAKEYYNTSRYSYDENGNLSRMDYDSGWTVYTYIAMG